MNSKRIYLFPTTEFVHIDKALCTDFAIGSGGDPDQALAPNKRTPVED